jgi:hypothetical protein
VAHICNPSYSGGRYKEDCSLKPAWQIVCETLSQKYLTEKGLVEWLKVYALEEFQVTFSNNTGMRCNFCRYTLNEKILSFVHSGIFMECSVDVLCIT